jgi:hypothetical protein
LGGQVPEVNGVRGLSFQLQNDGGSGPIHEEGYGAVRPLVPTMPRKAFKHYFVRSQYTAYSYFVPFGSFLERNRKAHVPFYSFLDFFWGHGRRCPLVHADSAVPQFNRWHVFGFGLCACACDEESARNQQREDSAHEVEPGIHGTSSNASLSISRFDSYSLGTR